MREFHRPPIACASCKANIYNWIAFLGPKQGDPANDVVANWGEPPRQAENCPRCGNPVDTTLSYPFLADFPPSFEALRQTYTGFTPKWEHNRGSFEAGVKEILDRGGFADLEAALRSDNGFQWYKQRMFYRSATAFYRCLQLFLGYLTLDRHCYRTWAEVTAYYSRFYFIQAFLNLILGTHLSLDRKSSAFVFFDGVSVRCIPDRDLPKSFGKGSHEIWWSLMEALKSPDYPCQDLGFVLSKLVFNPEQRNRVNYGYEYLAGGFNELDWFDSGADQMLNHFMPRPRADEDFTDVNRYFEGQDPGSGDVGDFASDNSQIVWCSLVGYLQILKSLGFEQDFVKTETIVALCDLHVGAEFPRLTQGIATSVSNCLQDNFDLESFLTHYRSADPPEPLTARWLLRGGQFYPKSRMHARPNVAPDPEI